MSKKDAKQVTETENTNSTSLDAVSKRELRKKELRRANDNNQGGLYIDPKYKEKGYIYRIVNDTPGRVKHLQNLGYEIVQGDMKVGSGTQNDTTPLGSAITLDAGKSKSQPALVMRISEEDYELRQEIKAEDNKEKTLGILNDTGIPTQYGEVNLRRGS
jgi:hypothetical protein